jgi:hypothetical protein
LEIDKVNNGFKTYGLVAPPIISSITNVYSLLTLSISNVSASSFDIMYLSNAAIAGFQFNVTGVTITGASGGAAEAAGFMISANEETVLGFSLDGATIPAGSGVLVVLDIEGDASAACLGEVILSDSDANVIDNMIHHHRNRGQCHHQLQYLYNPESYYLLH